MSKHSPWTALGAAVLFANLFGLPGAAHAHEEGMQLLPAVEDADFVAVASGNWSSPDTWDRGQVPIRTDAGLFLDVVIPQGILVTVDDDFSGADKRIDTLRLDGTLGFATTVSTRLEVDTLVSSATGVLRIGTPTAPIAANVTAEILIPSGILRADDTSQMGKGLVLNGPVHMHGASKLPFAAVTNGYTLGSGQLTLAEVPTGWRAGDEIAIAPGRFVRDANLSESFRIRQIAGNVVYLGQLDDATAPATLQHDHAPYVNEAMGFLFPVHVANLTRNVVIRSANPDGTRGHVMIHRGGARIAHAEFRGLGRTDKKVPLDDVTAGGTNQRGRYPLHFHRTLDASSTMSWVDDAVVNGSPGWGFVNHSSYVKITNSVSWNVDGAGFVCEASDEIGRFEGNIAIQGYGAPDGRHKKRRFEDVAGGDFQTGRSAHGDLAFTGDGFWVQSPAVHVVDNIAAGFQGHAFILWNLGLYEPDLDEQAGFRLEYLWDPQETYRTYNHPGAQHHGRALASDLAAKEFTGNVAYASFMGFMVRFHNHPNTTLMLDSQEPFVTGQGNYLDTTISNLTSWNNEYGFGLSYVRNLTIDGATIVTNRRFPLAINADQALEGGTTTFADVTIKGYEHAIDFADKAPDYELYHFCYSVSDWVIWHNGTSVTPVPVCP